MDYEKLHRRQTEIVCEDKNILAAVNQAIAHPETVENVILPTKITECTYCKQRGCLTRFVCHTAEINNAKSIISSGKLLSAVKAFNKTADEIVLDKRNAAGDPADFFDYIMFAWGNCQAGDRLVMERTLERSPTEDDLGKDFTPGVRFYFRHVDILKHPEYVFDGYTPAKVKDEIMLSDYLYACIIPEHYRNDFKVLIPSDFSDRVHYIPQDGLGILDWSERVYDFVEKIGEK
jgi:hypothetical protein